jgi:NADH:ubiquinone oxidoreductase subunit 2 (subunit N)
LPIFAGFTAKFYLFAAVADGGFLWLAGVAIFSSLISLYYYLQVLRQMYIELPAHTDHDEAAHDDHADIHQHAAHDEPPVPPMPRPSLLLTATMGAGLLVVVWLGIYPAPLLGLIDAASAAIVPLG